MNHKIKGLASLTLFPLLVISFDAISMQSIVARSVSEASVIAAYTLVAPAEEAKSRLIARAVLPMGVSCPDLKVTVPSGIAGAKSRYITMSEREQPKNTSIAFSPAHVCELAMPEGALSASIGSLQIPSKMPSLVKKMAIYGDTGCRMKKSNDQECASPNTWPLAQIAYDIQKQKPNLILFLGDFFYREYVCDPLKTLTCGISPPPMDINHDYNSVTNPFPVYPFSDTAYSWLADVFMPMRPLFTTAPIVVIRGNHESCSRGGVGYFQYFDPHLGNTQLCSPVPLLDANGQQIVKTVTTDAVPPVTYQYPQYKTAPQSLTTTWSTEFKVGAGRYLRLAIVDSAYGDEFIVTPDWTNSKAQYQLANDLTLPTSRIHGKVPENWLLSHQPQFGVDCEPDPISPYCKWVSATQTAAGYGLLDNYNLLLSSHIHLTQAVQIPGQAGQMILGDGGSSLQIEGVENYPPFLSYGPLQLPSGVAVPGLPAGMTPYPVPVNPIWTQRRFGYGVAIPGKKKTDWTWIHYGPDGSEFARCTQTGRSLTCGNT